jgi:RimJ/RimL family protein N-acetyltransferase
MQNNYETQRLVLSEIKPSDAEFILELVNTPEWIEFIGTRNVRNIADSNEYIDQIISNPKSNFWVVRTKNHQFAIGIITFIKKDYLDYYDIGFAFLSEHTNKGYAYEASYAVLHDAIKHFNYTNILATTVATNNRSIKLLKKLGLQFYKQIENEKEQLMVYSITADKFNIDQLTKSFYSIFKNSNNQKPDWSLIHTICLPETIIIKSSNKEEIYNLNTFVEPRKKILSDGTLTEFEEYETVEETRILDNIAQRYSYFQKQGYLNKTYFEEKGNKLFQYVKTTNGWKISSVLWEDQQHEQK